MMKRMFSWILVAMLLLSMLAGCSQTSTTVAPADTQVNDTAVDTQEPTDAADEPADTTEELADTTEPDAPAGGPCNGCPGRRRCQHL